MKKKYNFHLLNSIDIPHVDLVMSLDVIYHLVEDTVFYDHMRQLFNSKSKYVIVYSSDFDSKRKFHVRHRKWTLLVPLNYRLIKCQSHKLPKSSSSFFLYENNLL